MRHDQKQYTEEQLLQILRDRATKLGKTPTSRDMKKPHSTIYRTRFGSWNKAVQLAGLIPNVKGHKEKKWTDEELLQMIREQIDEGGTLPLMKQVPHNRTIRHRFGSWANAVNLITNNMKENR